MGGERGQTSQREAADGSVEGSINASRGWGGLRLQIRDLEVEFRENRHVLSPLFYAAHELIAEIRTSDEMAKGP